MDEVVGEMLNCSPLLF